MRLRRGCQAASRSRFQHGGEGPGLPRRLGDLLECALPRSFVGTKAEKLGAMAKAIAGDLVIIQRRHSAVRSVRQRLWPPGTFPVKPGEEIKASSLVVSPARSSLAIVEVTTT